MEVLAATLTHHNRQNYMNNFPYTRTSKQLPVNKHSLKLPRLPHKYTITETTPVVHRFLTIHNTMQSYPSTNQPSLIPVQTQGTLLQDKGHLQDHTIIHRATVTFRLKCHNNHSPFTCLMSNIMLLVFRLLQLFPTTTKLLRITPQHPHCHQNQPMPSSTSRANPIPRPVAAPYRVPAR